MPRYQYACTVAECGHEFEAVQSFSDDALTDCPACQGRLRKVISAVGVVFKGSGFYRTDSRADSRAGSGGERSGDAEKGGADKGGADHNTADKKSADKKSADGSTRDKSGASSTASNPTGSKASGSSSNRTSGTKAAATNSP